MAKLHEISHRLNRVWCHDSESSSLGAGSLSRPQITIVNSLERTENEILIKNNLAVYLFINRVLKRWLSAPVDQLVGKNGCHMTRHDEWEIDVTK